MSFIKEFWEFLKIRKKYWLLPIIIMLLLFGGLIVLTQGTAIAPFIYTIFYRLEIYLHLHLCVEIAQVYNVCVGSTSSLDVWYHKMAAILANLGVQWDFFASHLLDSAVSWIRDTCVITLDTRHFRVNEYTFQN